MERNRSLRVMAIIGIIVALVGLTVGYSTLQQTLLINAKTKVKGANWSVHFDTTSLSEAAIVGSAEVVAPATISVTNITLDVSLVQPKDSITYTFDVVNDGSLDAKLSAAPTLTGIDEALAKNVSFSLTYADNTAILANDELNVGDTKKLKLVVSMNDVEEVSAEDATLNLSATLLYVQK